MGDFIKGIVVASSRKKGGICLVVFEPQEKKFYRIISMNSDREDHELSIDECTYKDGQVINNLDFVELMVDSKKYISDEYQHENVVLRKGTKIIKAQDDKVTKNKLIELYGGETKLNEPKGIFINNYSSMTMQEAKKSNCSFLLVKVFGLKFYTTQNRHGEPTCKCSFKYNGIFYEDIHVTISHTKEEDIRKYANKSYPNGLVCFSFGHPFDGPNGVKCFKYLCSFLGYFPYNKNSRKKGDENGKSLLDWLFE